MRYFKESLKLHVAPKEKRRFLIKGFVTADIEKNIMNFLFLNLVRKISLGKYEAY